MINLQRTNSDDSDFQSLVRLLDAHLAEKNGEEHSYYAQYNKLDKIQHVVVAFADEQPVGCGAIKQYSDEITEVKRMFVHPDFRGRKISKLILAELENWAGELGFKECILETGWRQVEAIGLYQKSGYEIIPNYDQYIGLENSVCMKKVVSD
jgi:putative acetyltransferase